MTRGTPFSVASAITKACNGQQPLNGRGLHRAPRQGPATQNHFPFPSCSREAGKSGQQDRNGLNKGELRMAQIMGLEVRADVFPQVSGSCPA